MKKKIEEQNRGDDFCEHFSTSIWKETPSEENPYHTENAHCHGYNHLDLINGRNFSEVIFLIFKGELPTAEQTRLFDRLLVTLIHPGPRHPACRAAMSAATSKTHVGHILPLALNVLGGEHNGSHEVYRCMKFILQKQHSPAEQVAKKLLLAVNDSADTEGDITITPGFGSLFGSADQYTSTLAHNLMKAHQTPALSWCNSLLQTISAERPEIGWRITGIAAAALCDLGFSPYQGELCYQIASLPGIAAQAAEKSDAELTAMPFLPEDRYVIE